MGKSSKKGKPKPAAPQRPDLHLVIQVQERRVVPVAEGKHSIIHSGERLIFKTLYPCPETDLQLVNELNQEASGSYVQVGEGGVVVVTASAGVQDDVERVKAMLESHNKLIDAVASRIPQLQT